VCAAPAHAQARGVEPADLYKLRSVGTAKFSPDGNQVAYVIQNNDAEGRPYGQIWVMEVRTGKNVRIGAEKEPSGNPEWSPDGQRIAYDGKVGDKSGLVIAHADGSGARLIAETQGTNNPDPGVGRSIAWSPDGKRIAFVSAVPGPETKDATGDPIVITRYLYKQMRAREIRISMTIAGCTFLLLTLTAARRGSSPAATATSIQLIGHLPEI